uniref:RNA helicase, putative, 5' partial-related n=1 Tax=Oryza sativa subsp. japonica TaxID=39947 RepID=Q53M77_ORYSJ|nr:RNA helicase, putative, 5' partial-related [Oryza sativa Japonica Group]AAX96101.1 Similar to RNA helicase, putative, 5'''' partial [Oryza sativa Japonica Group]
MPNFCGSQRTPFCLKRLGANNPWLQLPDVDPWPRRDPASHSCTRVDGAGMLFRKEPALTVAAVLSAEITFRSTRSKDMEGKRKRQELPDGSGWGDHIQLLQIFESWDRTGYDPRWCSDHELQVRGMKFSKDVRNQLSQIIQKIAKGSTDVQAKKERKSDPDYRKLRRALCVGYGNQLAERMLHHNGYHTVGYRAQLVQVHPFSVLEGDEYGKLPVYVVYHELINTTRPFMRNVSAVDQSWVKPILKKLERLDMNKLSGGSSGSKDPEPLEDKQCSGGAGCNSVGSFAQRPLRRQDPVTEGTNQGPHLLPYNIYVDDIC